MAAFLHSGDLGDAIYCLPSVKDLGGGEIYFASRPWTRSVWGRSLLSAIKPLIEATGYATAHLHDGEWIDHDLSTYRNGGYRLGDTIMERQRRWVGAGKWDGKPWLKAEPNHVAPIIINRSARWGGWHFPWREILREFYDDIVFIGLREEHEAFVKEYGHVFYCPTRDLFEAAGLIAGCEVFVGNQSACAAIANGLGKAMVLEVCNFAPDCFIAKPDTFFSLNGEVELSISNGKKLSLPHYVGRFRTNVAGRDLESDEAEKLRIIARSVHALEGSFALYEEVPVNG